MIPVAVGTSWLCPFASHPTVHPLINCLLLLWCAAAGAADAEGRLILCDAVYDAASAGPDVLIDAATLTGDQLFMQLQLLLHMQSCSAGPALLASP